MVILGVRVHAARIERHASAVVEGGTGVEVGAEGLGTSEVQAAPIIHVGGRASVRRIGVRAALHDRRACSGDHCRRIKIEGIRIEASDVAAAAVLAKSCCTIIGGPRVHAAHPRHDARAVIVRGERVVRDGGAVHAAAKDTRAIVRKREPAVVERDCVCAAQRGRWRGRWRRGRRRRGGRRRGRRGRW